MLKIREYSHVPTGAEDLGVLPYSYTKNIILNDIRKELLLELTSAEDVLTWGGRVESSRVSSRDSPSMEDAGPQLNNGTCIG